jgi:hypothetical protein
MSELTEEEILALATPEMWGEEGNLQAHFEHNQWWVTDLATGAAWSVHLCSGPEAVSFEQVSEGDRE